MEIRLAAGTYTGPLNWNLTAAENVKLVGSGMKTTFIEGYGGQPASSFLKVGFSSAAGVEVQDLTIRNANFSEARDDAVDIIDVGTGGPQNCFRSQRAAFSGLELDLQGNRDRVVYAPMADLVDSEFVDNKSPRGLLGLPSSKLRAVRTQFRETKEIPTISFGAVTLSYTAGVAAWFDSCLFYRTSSFPVGGFDNPMVGMYFNDTTFDSNRLTYRHPYIYQGYFDECSFVCDSPPAYGCHNCVEETCSACQGWEPSKTYDTCGVCDGNNFCPG